MLSVESLSVGNQNRVNGRSSRSAIFERVLETCLGPASGRSAFGALG